MVLLGRYPPGSIHGNPLQILSYFQLRPMRCWHQFTSGLQRVIPHTFRPASEPHCIAPKPDVACISPYNSHLFYLCMPVFLQNQATPRLQCGNLNDGNQGFKAHHTFNTPHPRPALIRPASLAATHGDAYAHSNIGHDCDLALPRMSGTLTTIHVAGTRRCLL